MQTTPECPPRINSNERFVRWQTVLRNQLSFMNNLLLTISIGIIGFFVSFLKTDEFSPDCTEKVFFILGLLAISLSVFGGMVVGYSRIKDYRKTLKKISTELKKSKDLSELKDSMKFYENLTWVFFDLQIISLSIGIIFLLLAFCLTYSEKLF